jgi:hypothetical protein
MSSLTNMPTSCCNWPIMCCPSSRAWRSSTRPSGNRMEQSPTRPTLLWTGWMESLAAESWPWRPDRSKIWSPASPHINPCDFFLWGVMKVKVYKPMQVTMDNLKEKISNVFNEIPEEVVKKAVFIMMTRAAKMVAVEGKGFESKMIRL